MERNVCIIAGGMSKWGVRDGSQRDLFQEAAKACYDDNPHLNPKDIDGLLAASAYTERTSYQTHLAPLVAGICRNQAQERMRQGRTPLRKRQFRNHPCFWIDQIRTGGCGDGCGRGETLHATKMGSFL